MHCSNACLQAHHSVTRCMLLPSADSVNTAPKGDPKKGSVDTCAFPTLALLRSGQGACQPEQPSSTALPARVAA
eukprot:1136338-Pelagomonas_calceolata.AAC.3